MFKYSSNVLRITTDYYKMTLNYLNRNILKALSFLHPWISLKFILVFLQIILTSKINTPNFKPASNSLISILSSVPFKLTPPLKLTTHQHLEARRFPGGVNAGSCSRFIAPVVTMRHGEADKLVLVPSLRVLPALVPTSCSLCGAKQTNSPANIMYYYLQTFAASVRGQGIWVKTYNVLRLLYFCVSINESFGNSV